MSKLADHLAAAEAGKLRAISPRPLLFARADVLAAPLERKDAPSAAEFLRRRAAR